MKFKLCKILCKWFCGPELSHGDFWKASRRWEKDHSNEWDLWEGDTEEVRERNERSNEMLASDPVSAFTIHKELADNGSVWAMQQLARQYEFGQGVERDLALAEHYYHQAQLAGSWMATLHLSTLLFEHRINENWIGILENGVRAGFIPANFWLAWYRYQRNAQRKTALEIRPLMEEAKIAGHPGAQMILSRWKALGKFGMAEMHQGFRDFRSLSGDLRAGRLKNSAQQ